MVSSPDISACQQWFQAGHLLFLPVTLPWVHLVHISFPSYIIPGLELLENWYPGFGCLSKVEKWTLDGNPSVCWIHRASLIYIILLGSGDVWIDSPCWIIFTLISRNCLILCSALFLHCLFIWSTALDIYSNICTERHAKTFRGVCKWRYFKGDVFTNPQLLYVFTLKLDIHILICSYTVHLLSPFLCLSLPHCHTHTHTLTHAHTELLWFYNKNLTSHPSYVLLWCISPRC